MKTGRVTVKRSNTFLTGESGIYTENKGITVNKEQSTSEKRFR